MASLTYDAVIATRNRPEALALSIPLLLGQSRPPARLIVIDSSDDHAVVADIVRAAVEDAPVSLTIEEAPAGLTRQRNRGLAHVTAPVVFFPDDDSLLCAGAAEAILGVYERDEAGVVAGVCAGETLTPPEGVLEEAAYQMSDEHHREARFRWMRYRLQRKLPFLKPSQALGRHFNWRNGLPDWLDEVEAIPVEYMTGFRMTFRTEAIRAEGFDETLGAYALDEDVDASFSVMRHGLVTAAQKARVYHHRAVGGRGDSYARGRMEVLNRAYVLLKHAGGPLGSPALAARVWRWHLMFTTLKILSDLRRVHRQEGRARLAGAWAGLRGSMALRRARYADLSEVYARF